MDEFTELNKFIKETNKNELRKRICLWLMTICAITIIILPNLAQYYIENGKYLEPCACYSPVYLSCKTYDISEFEMRALLEKEFDTLYIYKVDDEKIGDFFEGAAYPLFRIVYMKSEYKSVYNYGRALAHELTHVKYQVANEAWTNFQMFKVLYESDSKILNELAKYCANDIFYSQFCYAKNYVYMPEYDVGQYIYEYLTEKEEVV